MQRRAFSRVALQLSIPAESLPPLCETVSQMAAMLAKGTSFFVALAGDGHIVGGVRAWVTEDGGVEIGRLVVDDGWTRRGVGSALMHHLEAAFPTAGHFRLFTGEDATDALSFYDRLGYRRTNIQDAGGYRIVWMTKPGLQ